MRTLVVDHHHHALRALLRLSPEPGRTLLHFDSHPDLSLPTAAVARRKRPEDVVAGCDIADWIAVLLLRGIVDRVV